MSKAAELAALIGSQSALSNRNLIINGAMQIFQRATSATNPAGGYDAADRWRQSQNNSGLGNFTIEQSTDAPAGFATSLKLTKSGATTQSANVSAYIQQYFEGQNVQQLQYGGSGAKKVTLSFYVKSSLTGTFGVCLQDGEAGKHNAQTYAISSANTWEYKTITFDGDTAASIANDNSAEFDLQFVLGAGTDYQTGTTNTWASGNKKTTSSQTQWPQTDGATWYVTGIQLEVGEQATPFEHRSYGEELAACQRYYQQIGGQTPANVLCVGQCTSSTLAQFFIPFIVPVRDDPTCSVSDQTHFRVFNAAVSGIPDTTNMTIAATNAASYGAFRIVATVGSGLSAGNATMLSGSDSDGNAGIIKMDAEL